MFPAKSLFYRGTQVNIRTARYRILRMGLAGFFRITRPGNSVIAGLAAIVAYLIATGTLVNGVLLLMAVVILITAAGNVINDYFDAEIDAINLPSVPSPQVR